MAAISRLDVLRLRNLSEVHIAPAESINILFGDNGSGKTSLLEAIHLLGLGRSFRSQKLEPLIQDGLEDCVVFGELQDGVSIGLSKTRKQGGHVLKLLGERQRSWVDAARHLPVQILNSESFSLLEGSPKVRRRFLDWGVFHVEHEFVNNWRKAAKCIAHRNLLLKERSLDRKQLQAWDVELVRLARQLDESRRSYFTLFHPLFQETLRKLIELPNLTISYSRGWDDSKSLEEVFSESLARDIKYGVTQNGPHRADLIVRVGRLGAEEVLSRGQQKLLVSAMKVAQGHLLSQVNGVRGVYLVDDLPSELDFANRRRVCELLVGLECQVFLTCVDQAELENCWSSALLPRKFHVEHGKISQ
ncbi:MAG: DNA replication/repair protein RecF [Gammaproteobacteria bacterium]|nr:DNA replication/repair protein RecF [Gammaproteobacteria bacterium]MDP2139673.1 DNA replication/repair protein RecF [Gammaproteobacteria bacterium]MDP2348877.1 DNA replication/repair protein RecF [Gammaproteobacteria bacterium]